MFYHDWKYTINPKKFDDIDPYLFHNFRFKTLLNYIFGIWLFLILKIAFFASDFYTCIKLLAFNSWSNDVIKPYVPFSISKWLYSGCILASIGLILWETICGYRIFRTRNIALCYINNFSRNIHSIFDYSKFCILDRISPKTTFEKFAFFVFFELKDCIGLIFTDTPRQVINGLTLWSVIVTSHDDMNLGDLESFNDVIQKIRYIAKTNHTEAVILSFMLFSFILWIFFMAKLIFAMICSCFVYYKLIREGEYSGLREFVSLTIDSHINDLIEKQKSKMANMDSVKTPILMNEFEDIEDRYTETFGFQKAPYKINDTSFNNSSFSLADSEVADGSFKNFHHQDISEIDVMNKPERLTSVIYDHTPIYIPQQQTPNHNQSKRPPVHISLNTEFAHSKYAINHLNPNQIIPQDDHVFTPAKAYFRGPIEQSPVIDNSKYESFILKTNK